METLCKIRDVYRAIAEFEVQFTQMYDLSLNEGMLLCTLLNAPKLTSSEIAEALVCLPPTLQRSFALSRERSSLPV